MKYPIVQTVHMHMYRISKRTSDVKQKHHHELPFLSYLFWLYAGSIPLLSWSMRAVKQPSLPALHHVPVTSPVGGSQLLICCLELASGGLASVKPLNDKIQVLCSLSPRFSTWTNGLFCLRHRDDCWQTRTDIHVHGCTNTHFHMQGKQAWTTQAHRFCPLPPPLPPSETQKMYDLSAAWRLLLRTSTIPGVCNRWCVYCGREHAWYGSWLWAARGFTHTTSDGPAEKRKGYSGLKRILS